MNTRSPGLRERKKARMRAEMQRQALRLFREQGYEATTISEIAAAAEVSESSFFRYFATKEDLVRWDALDPQIIEVFKAQPAGASPLRALRSAFREVLTRLSVAERQELRERALLVATILPLRAMLLDQALAAPGRPAGEAGGPGGASGGEVGGADGGGALRLLAEAVAGRAGRQPDDPAVLVFVGAVMGACVSALFRAAEDPGADLVARLDEALGFLEAGLPL